ncbi:MAG: tRNA (adenosine(37)-N6)-threonylcarbamoyltransferase complex dimerization subunit type 1 TsaB [Flavobacteriaceae bacterium]|nr:tRNA (adenosine(37)-N6)-threonylcarbamoyltransferase complex dimerization subunit type 1 TsaB [Flavobacteriaceae bacterium]
MGYILNIETATKNCSVSLSQNGETVISKELNNGKYSHAEVLHVFIHELFEKQGVDRSNLDAVAVSKGPGSYTGLRIGVSGAKGICYAFDVPLIAVNTLTSLAHAIDREDGFIVPMLDARRLEVYAAVFDVSYNLLEETQAVIIDENAYQGFLEKGKVYFLGDGAEKCKALITHPNANFLDSYFPSTIQMAKLSHEAYKKKQFEDVAYFEPFYLKDFIAVPEKKRKPIF